MVTSLCIVVFGSSQPEPGSKAYENARAVGCALAARGFTVATGGYGGVMEAVSRGAKETGGRVIGVTTEFYRGTRSGANRWVDEERSQPSWTARLVALLEMGDGYVAMPGGIGTLSELFLTWELMKNGTHPVRPFVLYGASYERIIDCLRVELGGEKAFAEYVYLLHFTSDPDDAVAYIARELGW